MIITFDGDGGGAAAHLRHWVGDAVLADMLGMQHKCLHPLLNSLFVSNRLCESEAVIAMDSIEDSTSFVIELASFKSINELKKECDFHADKNIIILSGKHHYSQIHDTIIGSDSRSQLQKKYHDHGLGLPRFTAMGAKLSSDIGLGGSYTSVQIRTFVDSNAGRVDFEQNYSYLLDQLVDELHRIKPTQCFLATDSNDYKQDIAHLVRSEGLNVITSDIEFEHSSYLFHYLQEKGITGLKTMNHLCNYLRDCSKAEGDALHYCYNAMSELSVLAGSKRIISTYSSYPIVASLVGSVRDLLVLPGQNKYLPLQGTF